MITYTKNIVGMRTETVTDVGEVVRFATLYVYGTNGATAASETIEIKLQDPDINNFTQLQNLNVENMLLWSDIQTASLDAQTSIAAEINKAGLSVFEYSDLPWNKP